MNGLLRRKILMISVILIVVALLIYGFLPKTQDVDIAVVKRGALQITIEEEGRTRLKDRFTISAPTAGYLRRIAAKVGDILQKGQVVAVLEPLPSQALDPRSRATAQAAVSSAEAALKAAMERERVAKTDAAYLEQKRERLKALYDKGSIAKDQFDQISSEAQKAGALQLSVTAEVNLARSELERANITLRNFSAVRERGNTVEVKSPVSGAVFRIYRESEGAVNVGEPLMDLGNSRDLEVRVEVLSSDAVKIQKGTDVLFKRWGKDEPLKGKVRLVEPAGFTKISSLGVEEQRVLVIVDITSPPEQWSMLGDGFRMEAHFVIWEGQNILQIPASALFRSGEKWSVFVVERGKARKRLVEIGRRNGLAAEILSGLKENDRVLAYPDDSISEGTKIRQRE
ncbi:MAG TPA: HlyD family efflux transporter periplasmic adaptor subunit [Smithella sp.]|nr:HlyD family efflux transporter periplasmic adaptor subunit [Smithella sp.]HOG88931.1 HlyD family efflux transporter periplasmic adaptor subunit [Smithella sp.]HQI71821.1 HlyD family efflux transporter periplasmic adaptor subunit [Smithella sp.]